MAEKGSSKAKEEARARLDSHLHEEHEQGNEEHHHHHGDENELDVVITPQGDVKVLVPQGQTANETMTLLPVTWNACSKSVNVFFQ